MTIAYVGSRTSVKRKARGSGITVWDPTGREWSLRQKLTIADPSWLVHDAGRQRLWALRGDGTTATACDIADDGTLVVAQVMDLDGRNPVHGTVDPSGRWLLTANHDSASVSIVKLHSDQPQLHAVQAVPALHLGTHIEQNATHLHQVVFDPTGRWVLIPDKGSDTIRVGVFDDGVLSIDPDRTIRLRTGSGPRHLTFTSDGAAFQTADEHGATLTRVRFDPRTGKGQPISVHPVQPNSVIDDCRPAEILTRGSRTYVSLRSGRDEQTPPEQHGSDVISEFQGANDDVRLVRQAMTPGSKPRAMAFNPDARNLLVAFEGSDAIARHDIAGDGSLRPGRVVARTGSPTAIVIA